MQGRAHGHVVPGTENGLWRELYEIVGNGIGSSGRTRTYNPSVNSRRCRAMLNYHGVRRGFTSCYLGKVG